VWTIKERNQADHAEDVTPMLLTVIVAAEKLSWNTRQIWKLVKDHRDAVKNNQCNNPGCESECGSGLASIRVGSRVFITKNSMESFIKNLQTKTFEELKKEDSNDDDQGSDPTGK